MSITHSTGNQRTPLKSKAKSTSVPKLRFSSGSKYSDKDTDDGLFNSKLAEIPKTERSDSPSPQLHELNDLLHIIPESPLKETIFKDDTISINFTNPPTNIFLRTIDQDDTNNTLKRQVNSLRGELNMKNELIEKLMKENNNLKNEMGTCVASMENNKGSLDSKMKMLQKRILQLEEENKKLKVENKLYKDQQTSVKSSSQSNKTQEMKEKVESYHKANKKSMETFFASIQNQLVEYLKDSEVKHQNFTSRLPNTTDSTVNKESNVQRTSQRKINSVGTRQTTKDTPTSSKAENRTTVAQMMVKCRKQSAVLESMGKFDFGDDDVENIVLTEGASDEKAMRKLKLFNSTNNLNIDSADSQGKKSKTFSSFKI